MTILITWLLCCALTILHATQGYYIQSSIWNAAALLVLVQGYCCKKEHVQ